MKRRCKQFIAMFLAISTILTGCVSDYNFYADELEDSVPEAESTLSDNDPNEETVEGLNSEDLGNQTVSGGDAYNQSDENTDEDPIASGQDTELDIKYITDGEFSAPNGVPIYVSVPMGGKMTLSSGDTYIIISRDQEDIETVKLSNDDVTHFINSNTGMLYLSIFEEGTIVSVEVESNPGYKIGQYSITMDSGAVEEVTDFESETVYLSEAAVSPNMLVSAVFKEEVSHRLYADVKGIGTVAVVVDEDYYWLECTEDTISLTDAEGRPIEYILTQEGYIYLGSYTEGSVVNLGIAAEDSFEVKYDVSASDGSIVKTETGYGYLAADFELSDDYVVKVDLNTQEEDLSWLEPAINWDWRVSTAESLIYNGYDLADDPVLGKGQKYWGETIVELIAMANDPTFDMTDDWDSFFEGTVYYGTDYDGLLYLYKNGYNLFDLGTQCAELEDVFNIWDMINGTKDYTNQVLAKGTIGMVGRVTYSAGVVKAYIPDLWGNKAHNVLTLKINNYYAFCVDPSKPMGHGDIVYLSAIANGPSGSLPGLGSYMRNVFGNFKGTASDIGGIFDYAQARIFAWNSGVINDKFYRMIADYTVSTQNGWGYNDIINDPWRSGSGNHGVHALQSFMEDLRHGKSTTLKYPQTDWSRAYNNCYGSIHFAATSGYHHGDMYLWTKNKGTTEYNYQRLVTIDASTITITNSTPTNSTPNKNPGRVVAIKRTTDGTPLDGAVFTVLDAKLAIVGTITTAGGIGELTLNPGTYYIRETQAPEGYELDSKIVQFPISAGNNFYYEYSLEDPETKYGKIIVKKTNQLGQRLSGCTFSIYTDSNCTNCIGSIVTTTNGEDSIDGLELGTYYVKETAAPAIYTLDSSVYTAEVTESTNCEYTISATNRYSGALFSVDKKDIDTGESINLGGVFQVLDRQYNVVYAELYSYGTCFLDPGKYILRETVAPLGYALAEDIFFEIKESDRSTKVSVPMYDKANEYQFLKLSTDTGAPLSGAFLSLRCADGTVYDEWYTDGSPHVIKALPSGTYTLIEKQAPDGYIKAPNKVFTVDSNHTETVYVEVYNAPRTLSILKADEKTGEGLAGAHLELWTVNSSDTPVSKIDSWVSDGLPHVVTGIKLARYAVIETKAPDGYILSPTTIIEFGHQHNASCYNRHVHSDEECGIICSRYCGWNDRAPGEACPNCGAADESMGCTGDGRFGDICEATGLAATAAVYCAHCHEYNCGKSEVDELVCKIPESNGGSQVYTVYNKKVDKPEDITVSVEKSGPSKNNVNITTKIAGATLQIKTSSGTVIKQWVSSTENIVFTDIPAGTYILSEINPPAGYVRAEDIVFTVRSTSTTQLVSMRDDIIKVAVKKISSDGSYVGGAKLQILTQSGSVYAEWTTVYGQDYVVNGIPAGTYTLHEVSAPRGYRIAKDVQFTVQSVSGVQTVTMVDEPLKIAFVKKDVSTGKNISGAQLQLWTTKDGVTKDSIYAAWTSSTNPHVISNVPIGNYILVEAVAPKGYVRIQETPISVTGNCNSTVSGTEVELFTISNDYTRVEFNKTDIHTNIVLPNCEFYLWYADDEGKSTGKLADTWVSDGTPHRIDRLPVGRYRLEELSTVTGYSVADPLIIDVNELTSLQSFTMKNDYLYVGFELTKVDSATGEIIGSKADDYGNESVAQFELQEYNNTLNAWEKSRNYSIVYVGGGKYSVTTTLTWSYGGTPRNGFLYWSPANNGMFRYRETKSPYGYELDNEWVEINIIQAQLLENDWEVVREDPAGGKPYVVHLGHNAYPDLYPINDSTVFANVESRGGFGLVKWDTDSVNTDRWNTAQGDSALEGFEFTIYNRSVRPIWYYPNGVFEADNRKLIPVNGAVCTMTTDSLGRASVPVGSLPYGTYEVIETNQGAGYMCESDNSSAVGSITFNIKKLNDSVKSDFDGIWGYIQRGDLITGQKYIKDDVIRGGVQIQKWDLELNKSEAIGGANHGNNEKGTHLEGIQFEIKNVSQTNSGEELVGTSVYVDGAWYNYGTVVKTITTHWNQALGCYTAETAADTLPYGTYEIYESAASPSYNLNPQVHRFQIREDGRIVTLNTDGGLLVTKDQVVRGDIRFTKVEESTHRLMKVPFEVTNLTTGETHIIVTDENGGYNSTSTIDGAENRPHSNNTNNNDWLIDASKAEGHIAKTADQPFRHLPGCDGVPKLSGPKRVCFSFGETKHGQRQAD